MGYFRINCSFAYQSQDIDLNDWLSIFTLCLTPLIAHLIGGVPTATYLCESRPHWHDRITHYNPTSIVWRYFAIADRRLRTKLWTSSDLAATGALFWTARGWDGGEDMVQRSRTHKIPGSNHTHVNILSSSAFKTTVVTLQGIQAIYMLVGSGEFGTFENYLALNRIFFPLAIFGLLRLPAALWLSDEIVYRSNDPASEISKHPLRPPIFNLAHTESEPLDLSDEAIFKRYHAPHSWRGILIRALWMIIIAGLVAVAVLQIYPHPSDLNFTLTSFSVVLFYLLFLTITLVIITTYNLRGSTSTIIPCINQGWYKQYTFILFLWMLVMTIIAALGTRKMRCGYWTSWPSEYDDMLCPYSVPVSATPANDTFSGLLGKTRNGTLVVGMFDGWCQGRSSWGVVDFTSSGIL
ncbi:hypothetical protein EG329_014446 [Mollisiaceae sp. DMI_Dod_QoI]|nr:hypothetical protein EG329_014446 [Helotiales sp. DMI_Dod_QoI]